MFTFILPLLFSINLLLAPLPDSPTPTPGLPSGYQLVPLAPNSAPLRLPFNPGDIHIRELGVNLPDVTLSIDMAMYIFNVLWKIFIIPVGILLGFSVLHFVVNFIRYSRGLPPISMANGAKGSMFASKVKKSLGRSFADKGYGAILVDAWEESSE